MPPKTPSEIKEQIEKARAEQSDAEGQERTAEGMQTRTPSRDEFLANLKKASEPDSATRGADE